MITLSRKEVFSCITMLMPDGFHWSVLVDKVFDCFAKITLLVLVPLD